MGAAFVAESSYYVPGAYVLARRHQSTLGFAGVAIGLVLTLIQLVGIPITNTS